ncbi:hypothetical protein HNP92_000286 [Methanococcus maripaludis]|uniref:Lipoprotein n=1 Tax=Methanococcus maripaludis TaxID=39152 RepID=A0A7J9NY71_METMI|nr:hypothetical protein [Methanococcus maripaludis]MBA2852650.1 hypothetical protein [Methanococcus maripaludis]MBB6401001.1 hypothetical protein [Methanococcus maripaludis]
MTKKQDYALAGVALLVLAGCFTPFADLKLQIINYLLQFPFFSMWEPNNVSLAVMGSLGVGGYLLYSKYGK